MQIYKTNKNNLTYNLFRYNKVLNVKLSNIHNTSCIKKIRYKVGHVKYILNVNNYFFNYKL